MANSPCRPETKAYTAVAHVLLATAAGGFLRTLAAAGGGLWRDEALLIFVIRVRSWRSMLTWIATQESHPPFFYVIARLWSQVFGSGERTMVALSVLLGTLIIPLSFWYGRRLLDTKAGCLAAYVTALSPGLIEYSAAVRPYALLSLLCLVSLCSLAIAVRDGRQIAWITYSLATLALLLTHNWAVLVVAAECVTLSLLLIGQQLRIHELRRARWPLLVAGMLYAVWMPILLQQSRHAGHAPADLHTVGWLVRPFRESPSEMALLVVWCLAVPGWLWLHRPRGRYAPRPSSHVSMALLIGVPMFAFSLAAAASLSSQMLFFRCVTIVLPPVIMAVAIWMTSVFGKRALFLGSVLALLQFAAAFATSATLRPYRRSNGRELAALIDGLATAGDMIVVAPLSFAPSLNLYLSAPNEQIGYPLLGRQELISYADVQEQLRVAHRSGAAERRIRAAHSAGRRIWLVRPTGIRSPAKLLEAARVDWNAEADLESIQLRRLLVDLYGAPVREDVGPLWPVKYEGLIAELFSADSIADPDAVVSRPSSARF